MGKVLILIDEEFEDMEAMSPFYRLQESGHRVEVVGSALKRITENTGIL